VKLRQAVRIADADTEPVPEPVGFIGLGNLGRHLAASLLRAGYPLTVHDLDRSAAAPLLGAGATWAGSPRATAAAATTVVTCLPSPAAVAAVLEGEHGVLAGLAPGGVWIDTSTTDRNELRRLAALAAERGIGCLEAPVTGGVHKAAAGEITVLVGGDEELFEAKLALLSKLGSPVLHIGPLGSAAVIKLVTNMLAFVHLVAVGEALVLAKRGGVDLRSAFEAIRASSGNSFVHETESQVILSGSYDIGFTLDLALKDLDLVRGLAAELGVPVELAELVAQRFERARETYGGSAWSPTVVKLLEDAVGAELRAPGFPARLEG
jgi:3-hydroxyisobutyrate dehydrogenase